jgi:hypothetical protein
VHDANLSNAYAPDNALLVLQLLHRWYLPRTPHDVLWPAADGQPGRKYLALLLPSKSGAETGMEDAVHGEGRYRWAREFAIDTQEFGDSSKSYVLALSDTGARYVPIESNLMLSKRKRDDLLNIEPPEHVRFQLN